VLVLRVGDEDHAMPAFGKIDVGLFDARQRTDIHA
jgi:hypothetical protein